MISFRFHVVSITAIFLAIAIGVVVGSTYVDDAVSGPLRNRIDTVEQRAEDARDENSRLEGDLDAARDFITLSSEYAVTDRLTDVPVAVLAVRGVEESAVERTVVLARRAGASVPGVVWIEPRWALEGEGDLEALDAVVGRASASDTVEELQARAWDAVAGELAGATDPTGVATGDEQGPTGGGGVLVGLEEGGFVSVDALGDDAVDLVDLIGADPRLLVVTGSRAEAPLAEMVPAVLAAGAGAELVSVVADVHVSAEDAPGRGEALTSALPEDVQERVVIVDDADREEGRLAAVLSLQSAATGEAGLHYGYGDDADAVLPAWTAP
jgi:hypothetical protein